MMRIHGEKGISVLILLIIMTVSCIGITGCGANDELTDDDLDYLVNEGSDDKSNVDSKTAAEAKAMNQDIKNFIGTWNATSDEAKNYYGSLEITINDDGTFDAVVTGERFSGTWNKVDEGITYTSELMNGNIYFGDYGKLIIEDTETDIRVNLNKVD